MLENGIAAASGKENALSCIGEVNGNPLPCSCLENPRDSRAWWAAVYGVVHSLGKIACAEFQHHQPTSNPLPSYQAGLCCTENAQVYARNLTLCKLSPTKKIQTTSHSHRSPRHRGWQAGRGVPGP